MRVLDYFFKYAGRHEIVYTEKHRDGVTDLYSLYCNHVRFIGKLKFDPVRRSAHKRFTYTVRGVSLDTTPSQLAFMRFVYQNNVMDYLLPILDDVRRDMRMRLHEQRSKQKSQKSRRYSMDSPKVRIVEEMTTIPTKNIFPVSYHKYKGPGKRVKSASMRGVGYHKREATKRRHLQIFASPSKIEW
jgi:hypothetical protein